jgi:hypothetical protein
MRGWLRKSNMVLKCRKKCTVQFRDSIYYLKKGNELRLEDLSFDKLGNVIGLVDSGHLVMVRDSHITDYSFNDCDQRVVKNAASANEVEERFQNIKLRKDD